MIGQTIGNLKIVSEIGEGGMGVVYLAENIRLDKKLAVKCLAPRLTQEPQFAQRFYQEAKNQALLDHPNIVRAFDFLEAEGCYLLVMEYVEGEELGKLIEKKGRLPEPEALKIFKDILSGLGFAHRKGLIHRDMKPSNVLIDSEGRARIMDFGIAILAGDPRITVSGQAVGSPWYMSPEQITHPAEIDSRSDIYSLGIVLYEMLTGKVPFESKSEFEVQTQQVKARPPSPGEINPDLGEELSQMVLKALEKNPDDRFQTCAEFLERIEAYQSQKQIRQPSQTKSIPGMVIAAVLVVVLVGAGLGIYWWAGKDKVEHLQSPGKVSAPVRSGEPGGAAQEGVPQGPEAAPLEKGSEQQVQGFSQGERQATYSVLQSALSQGGDGLQRDGKPGADARETADRRRAG